MVPLTFFEMSANLSCSVETKNKAPTLWVLLFWNPATTLSCRVKTQLHRLRQSKGIFAFGHRDCAYNAQRSSQTAKQRISVVLRSPSSSYQSVSSCVSQKLPRFTQQITNIKKHSTHFVDTVFFEIRQLPYLAGLKPNYIGRNRA